LVGGVKRVLPLLDLDAVTDPVAVTVRVEEVGSPERLLPVVEPVAIRVGIGRPVPVFKAGVVFGVIVEPVAISVRVVRVGADPRLGIVVQTVEVQEGKNPLDPTDQQTPEAPGTPPPTEDVAPVPTDVAIEQTATETCFTLLVFEICVPDTVSLPFVR
jgi:hypothetical protein